MWYVFGASSFFLVDGLADYEKSMNEEDPVILFNTMGSAASRVYGSSSPTVSFFFYFDFHLTNKNTKYLTK